MLAKKIFLLLFLATAVNNHYCPGASKSILKSITGLKTGRIFSGLPSQKATFVSGKLNLGKSLSKLTQSSNSRKQLSRWLVALPLGIACSSELERPEEKTKLSTAFFNALKMNDLDTMQLLLTDLNLNQDSQNTQAGLALHVATDLPSVSIETLMWLVAAGSDVHAPRKSDGYTPLHILASHTNQNRYEQLSDTQKFNFFMQKRAKTTAIDAKGNTPLHVAVLSKNIQIITLLKNSPSLHIENYEGYTPYDLANKNGWGKIFQQLLENISDR